MTKEIYWQDWHCYKVKGMIFTLPARNHHPWCLLWRAHNLEEMAQCRGNTIVARRQGWGKKPHDFVKMALYPSKACVLNGCYFTFFKKYISLFLWQWHQDPAKLVHKHIKRKNPALKSFQFKQTRQTEGVKQTQRGKEILSWTTQREQTYETHSYLQKYHSTFLSPWEFTPAYVKT